MIDLARAAARRRYATLRTAGQAAVVVSLASVSRQPVLVSCQDVVIAADDDSRSNLIPPIANRTGDKMEVDLATRIASNPKYQELKSKRMRFGWWLTLAVMVAYYGFILLVAFNKPFLATKLGAGVMTVGMPLGVAVIVFTIVITAVYVRRANSEFDALTAEITKGALK